MAPTANKRISGRADVKDDCSSVLTLRFLLDGSSGHFFFFGSSCLHESYDSNLRDNVNSGKTEDLARKGHFFK